MHVLFLLTFFAILLALITAQECRQVALCGQELRNFDEYSKLKDFLLPASCYTSSVYGRQSLRSGEEAFCDEGWTVFQRRFNGSVDFQRNWADYKSGFGSMDGEYWLGLDKIQAITRGRGCKLRVDLWDFTNDHRFAEYSMFSVENESDLYRLHIGGYSGTAGDSMASGSNSHNNQRFSTYNVDNDNSNSNCATHYGNGSGGWWFNKCFLSSLNADWGDNQGRDAENIIWSSWKGYYKSLKATTMKVKCG